MSKELPKTYDHSDVESRLYEKWEKKGYFHAEANPEKKPYCIVMPPPNITGKLHMGHALDNTLQDFAAVAVDNGHHKVQLHVTPPTVR